MVRRPPGEHAGGRRGRARRGTAVPFLPAPPAGASVRASHGAPAEAHGADAVRPRLARPVRLAPRDPSRAPPDPIAHGPPPHDRRRPPPPSPPPPPGPPPPPPHRHPP